MSTATLPTVADYARIFEVERQNEYPVIDAFEARMGYAIDRAKLEEAARVLACPLKKNPPNWQHGRVIYSAVRQALSEVIPITDEVQPCCNMLDIGTAKGFSALCMFWALDDSGVEGSVTSVDVLDPLERVRRNTVAELDGLKSVQYLLLQWLDKAAINLKQRTGIDELSDGHARIHVCFIDGKHSIDVVLKEGHLLALRQIPGDLAIFDDLQLIGPAVDRLEREGLYAFERLWIKKDRGYAVGVRRG